MLKLILLKTCLVLNNMSFFMCRDYFSQLLNSLVFLGAVNFSVYFVEVVHSSLCSFPSKLKNVPGYFKQIHTKENIINKYYLNR